MNQKKRASISDNVTINLGDFIWKVLIRWRVICVIGIIVGLIAMAVMYRRDVAAYEVALSAPSTEKELRESLTFQERRIVDFVIRNEKLVNSYSAYMNDSPLANINPFAEKIERVTFVINPTNPEDTATIRAAYDSFLSSSEYLEGMQKLLPEEYDKTYADELSYTGASYGTDASAKDASDITDASDNRLLTVSVILLEGMDADEVSGYVEDAFSIYSAKLGSALPHTLTSIAKDETTIVDSALPITQREYIDAAIASDSYLASAKNYFSEGQKKLYDLYMEDITGEEYYAAPDPDAESEAAGEAGEAEIVAPHMSVKYIVLGFVAGALAYIFIYLVIVLFRPRIKTADECEDALGIRTLGELHEYHETGIRRLMYSRMIYNLQHKRTLDTKLQTGKVRDSLAALSHKKKDANIEIVALDKLNDRAREIVSSLMDECKENGINISLLEGDVNTDTTFHRTLSEASDMVLLLTADKTKYPDIDLALNLASESDVDIAGTMFCEV